MIGHPVPHRPALALVPLPSHRLLLWSAGRILAGGIAMDGTFVEEFDPAIDDQTDAAYRTGYRYTASIANTIATPPASGAAIAPRAPER